jgi:hypothetical protein
MLEYFTAICTFCVLWYIFTRFGVLYQDKSGNPDLKGSSFFDEEEVLFLAPKNWSNFVALYFFLIPKRLGPWRGNTCGF